MRSLGCLWQIKHVSWGSDAAPARGLEQQGLCQLPCSVSQQLQVGGTLQFSAPEQTIGHGTTNQCWSHWSLGNSLEITSIFICKILEEVSLQILQTHTFQKKLCVLPLAWPCTSWSRDPPQPADNAGENHCVRPVLWAAWQAGWALLSLITPRWARATVKWSNLPTLWKTLCTDALPTWAF